MTTQQQQFYFAVMNHEEQYSVWPEGRELPGGWKQVFGPSQKDACLDFIEENWTDMRPQSLREHMDTANS